MLVDTYIVCVCVCVCVYGTFFKLGDVTGCRMGPSMGLEISVLYELHLLSCNKEKQANGIVMSVYSPPTPPTAPQSYSYQLTVS
jgi:hypothetical protein